ncbi:Acetyltransferases, including N-acetylases of ribosomal proteins [Modestobacter sp. DSM 44400]|uniref:GNAT family N-acetyltransferase n=1 Tax=Modestobacter sp. DSM 44400 TaxID=1550230 RepID=UPI00089762D2|nr:GNAT family protein [Modestobacter sp. DSM 44400]SDY16013.1 Acetyltransferases, including N-acetylases of ribosomal proteins [Modestobacter sp. DSM 44400]
MNDVDIRTDDDRRVTVVAVLDVPPEGVQAFQRYESRVLPLLARHDGWLDRRLRSADGTTEVHVLSFPSDEAYRGYLADSERVGSEPLLAGADVGRRVLELLVDVGPPLPVRAEIVHLNLPALEALAAGDLAAAGPLTPVPVTPYLVGSECRGVWRMRAAQVAADPVSAAWVTGLVWDPDGQRTVGRAGFHGPPDAAGMVEVGYSIDPAHRRRGHAQAVLRVLLARAVREPAVRTVRASVRPDNTASRDLVLAHGFRQVGEQDDPEDGLEIVYEVPAGS